jgi:hypothetical protein
VWDWQRVTATLQIPDCLLSEKSVRHTLTNRHLIAKVRGGGEAAIRVVRKKGSIQETVFDSSFETGLLLLGRVGRTAMSRLPVTNPAPIIQQSRKRGGVHIGSRGG